jgi:hypothetical protein
MKTLKILSFIHTQYQKGKEKGGVRLSIAILVVEIRRDWIQYHTNHGRRQVVSLCVHCVWYHHVDTLFVSPQSMDLPKQQLQRERIDGMQHRILIRRPFPNERRTKQPRKNEQLVVTKRRRKR